MRTLLGTARSGCYIAALFSTTGWSQDGSAEVDSLRRVLERATNNTDRAIQQARISDVLNTSDTPAALVAARAAMAFSKLPGGEGGYSQALHAMAMSHDVNNNADSAIHYATLSMRQDEKAGDPGPWGRSCNTLGIQYIRGGELAQAETHFLKALELGLRAHDTLAVADVYTNLAMVAANQGDHVKTLRYDILSLKLSEQQKDLDGMGRTYNNIAIDYKNLKDYGEARTYAQRALEVSLRNNDLPNAAATYLTLGTIQFQTGLLDSAALSVKAAIKLIETTGDLTFLTEAYNNMATIMASRGDLQSARTWLEKALERSRAMGDDHSTMYVLHELGANALARKDHRASIAYYEEALPTALRDSALQDLDNIYLGLQKAYAGLGDHRRAYDFTELYNAVHDRLNGQATREQLALVRTEFETEKKEHAIQVLSKDNELQGKEIERQRLVRNGLIGGALALLVFAMVVLMQKRRIARERARSEELLLNILPAEIAQELKDNGEAQAREVEQVTILFTDFKGFTQLSEQLTAQDLVAEINTCFKAFDGIMARYGVEKIKTIGDAYMAAGGLPRPQSSSVKATINAALEMQDFMYNYRQERTQRGEPAFEMRVGIHTGPVVAGIVGVKKFQYDVWGDTVNTASRMESSGEVGQVNISESTYALVMDDPELRFVHRGLVQAKGKGEMAMFFVMRSATEAS